MTAPAARPRRAECRVRSLPGRWFYLGPFWCVPGGGGGASDGGAVRKLARTPARKEDQRTPGRAALVPRRWNKRLLTAAGSSGNPLNKWGFSTGQRVPTTTALRSFIAETIRRRSRPCPRPRAPWGKDRYGDFGRQGTA